MSTETTTFYGRYVELENVLINELATEESHYKYKCAEDFKGQHNKIYEAGVDFNWFECSECGGAGCILCLKKGVIAAQVIVVQASETKTPPNPPSRLLVMKGFELRIVDPANKDLGASLGIGERRMEEISDRLDNMYEGFKNSGRKTVYWIDILEKINEITSTREELLWAIILHNTFLVKRGHV